MYAKLNNTWRCQNYRIASSSLEAASSSLWSSSNDSGRQLSNWANQAKDHFPTTTSCPCLNHLEEEREWYFIKHRIKQQEVVSERRERGHVPCRPDEVAGGQNHFSRANKRRILFWAGWLWLGVLFFVNSRVRVLLHGHRQATAPSLRQEKINTGQGGSGNSKFRWSCLEIFHCISIFIEL